MAWGDSIILFIEETLVLWAVPSWLLAVYLVSKPRQGLGSVAGISSAETELWLGQAPCLSWNWLEEWAEPESGQALVISGKEGRKGDSRI